VVVGHGGTDLDSFTWGTMVAGTALQLDPDIDDRLVADTLSNWCAARETYGSVGSFGSPGDDNQDCLQAGECFGDGGVVRAINPPEAGDLVINEFIANPNALAATDDAGFEFIEVYGVNEFDLNGVVVRKLTATPAHTISSPNCLTVPAMGYFVLANGAISQADYVFPTTLTLNNTASGIIFEIPGTPATLLDQITYTAGEVVTAQSRALRDTRQTSSANDTAANWCAGSGLYDGTNSGSPGMANPNCPAPP
jgi:hypothetical protein